MNRMLLSIITLTLNSEAYIRRMLESVTSDIVYSSLDAEIIIVDNGSTDGTVSVIEEFKNHNPQLHLIRLSRNHGTTAPRNMAIRQARGEYVLILDSDTEINPGALELLLRSFDVIPGNKDRIAIVHPKLVYPDGSFQESARRIPTLFTKIYRMLGIEVLRRRNETIQAVIDNRITPVDYAISAAWLIPRRVFDIVGLLDERIFYSPEDLEFCMRCWSNGLMVWYYPHATIIHHCQRISARRPLSRMGRSHIKGLLRLWFKYHTFLARYKFEQYLHESALSSRKTGVFKSRTSYP